MAPLKALVTERFLDWRARLAPLGVSCEEVTGDTDHDDFATLKHTQVSCYYPRIEPVQVFGCKDINK